MAVGERRLEELERVVDEQAALRRIATLVAAGATEADLADAVSSEIGGLFGAQSATVLRWDGDTIRVIGSWRADSADAGRAGAVLGYGGDTITARVVETAAPARVDSAAALKTDFGRERWAELGLEASIGAPIMVERKVWGVVAAFRRKPGDMFAQGDEERLSNFAALVAQAIANAEARSETAALVAEQSTLRQIAMLVAAGRPQAAVLGAVTEEAGMLFGALIAARAAEDAFPAGAEIRLRGFADLAAQAIANERAQAELRASRARIVQTGDEARRRLERNLHDGAQQQLVSVSLALRLVERMFEANPSTARVVLHEASNELADAMQELRELARGLHPALLSELGLGPALDALSARSPFPVEITDVPADRLPGPVEAAIYYVVSESLTNAAKHAAATSATVSVLCSGDTVTVEIADDGSGGATLEAGSGLRGLVDRVEALGGELTVSSPRGAGTLVRAELPLREPAGSAPVFPPKLAADLSTLSSEVSWEPVWVLVSAEGNGGEEMLSLLGEEYGAAGEREGNWWKLTIRPIDQFRRGTIIYRVIQASRTLADRHPELTIYLVTEDGNRWRLPPPSLEPDD